MFNEQVRYIKKLNIYIHAQNETFDGGTFGFQEKVYKFKSKTGINYVIVFVYSGYMIQNIRNIFVYFDSKQS